MTQRTMLRRRQSRAVTAAAVAVLALGGLTACEDELPVDDGSEESQEPGGDGPGESDSDTDGDGDGAEDGADEDDAADSDGDGDRDGDSDGGERDDDGFLGVGETYVWDDGLEITVGAAEEFVPDYAEVGGVPYKVEVAVSNSGDEAITSSLLVQARSGEAGVAASRVYDGALNAVPDGTVQPGRTLTGDYGFETPPDSSFMDLTIKPTGGDHEEAVWSLDLEG